MRYENWDVLLYPQGGDHARIPLQEFKTDCDVVQDPSKFLGLSNVPSISPIPTVVDPFI